VGIGYRGVHVQKRLLFPDHRHRVDTTRGGGRNSETSDRSPIPPRFRERAGHHHLIFFRPRLVWVPYFCSDPPPLVVSARLGPPSHPAVTPARRSQRYRGLVGVPSDASSMPQRRRPLPRGHHRPPLSAIPHHSRVIESFLGADTIPL
jgi:hypothetical protein